MYRALPTALLVGILAVLVVIALRLPDAALMPERGEYADMLSDLHVRLGDLESRLGEVQRAINNIGCDPDAPFLSDDWCEPAPPSVLAPPP